MIEYQVDLTSLNHALKRARNRRTVQKAVDKALATVAKAMRVDIIPRVPRKQGALVNSWRVEKQMNNDIIVGFDIIYAAYQERGKRKDGRNVIRNRPSGGQTGFMRFTIEENLQNYFELYKNVVFSELFMR